MEEQPGILVGYEFALPVGELRDFLDNVSPRGFEFGAVYPVFRSLYVGPYFNHHTFYQERGTETYQLENGAVTGALYRYAKFWSVGALARYHFFEPDSFARPFVGVRLGIQFLTAATLVSDLSFYDNPTGFAFSPEGGVLLNAMPVLQVALSVRYDYSTASALSFDSGSYVAYHVGFVFRSKD